MSNYYLGALNDLGGDNLDVASVKAYCDLFDIVDKDEVADFLSVVNSVKSHLNNQQNK